VYNSIRFGAQRNHLLVGFVKNVHSRLIHSAILNISARELQAQATLPLYHVIESSIPEKHCVAHVLALQPRSSNQIHHLLRRILRLPLLGLLLLVLQSL